LGALADPIRNTFASFPLPAIGVAKADVRKRRSWLRKAESIRVRGFNDR
jgi:hypothetical protein